MPDVHIPQEDPTTSQRVGAKVESLIADGHELYASAVTGTPSGRVRRPTLFVIAIVGAAMGPLFPPAAIPAVIAILLLGMTDAVVEL